MQNQNEDEPPRATATPDMFYSKKEPDEIEDLDEQNMPEQDEE